MQNGRDIQISNDLDEYCDRLFEDLLRDIANHFGFVEPLESILERRYLNGNVYDRRAYDPTTTQRSVKNDGD